MSDEEESLQALRRERAARVKRILRWMPRRATMHRYPILKWFSKSARTRPYLWAFRVTAVVPALYAGCILAFLPLYGVQVALAVLLAFLLRANLPILVALQVITNPVSAIPIYYTAYQIGRISLSLFGVSAPHLSVSEIGAFFRGVESGAWALNVKHVALIWSVMSLGGAMMGSFVATIASIVYRVGAKEATLTLQKLQAVQEKRRLAQEEARHVDQLDLDFPEKHSSSSER